MRFGVDENTKAVLIVAIGAIVTVATTYIAARWHVSRGLQARDPEDRRSTTLKNDLPNSKA